MNYSRHFYSSIHPLYINAASPDDILGHTFPLWQLIKERIHNNYEDCHLLIIMEGMKNVALYYKWIYLCDETTVPTCLMDH